MLMIGRAGGWTLRSWQSPPTVGTAALARKAATSYAVYASDAARPVRIAASQRQQLERWFSQRLDRPVRAPDLYRVGLTLIGGRLIATEHGPAGLYLYRYADGTRVAIYLRPMEVDGNARMIHRDERGVAGWTRANDGLGFGVFEGGGSPALDGAADLVRSQYDHI
jgi:anti-sigma factor RsiW